MVHKRHISSQGVNVVPSIRSIATAYARLDATGLRSEAKAILSLGLQEHSVTCFSPYRYRFFAAVRVARRLPTPHLSGTWDF